MFIKTNQGLGDCIYLRPVLRWLPHKEIYLETPWPQVFVDMPQVKCVKPKGKYLRTQQANIDKYSNWCEYHYPHDVQLGHYGLRKYSIIGYFCSEILGQQPSWFNNQLILPQSWIVKAKALLATRNIEHKKVCLIRPNTLRQEWLCPARNPKIEYLQAFIDKYRNDYFFVSLANLCDGAEVYDGKLSGVDWEITANIPIETVMGMFYKADTIIASPSFWTALGMALNCNMLLIYGAHESHFAINDRRIKAPNCRFIEPDPFDICDLEKANGFKDIAINSLNSIFEEVHNDSR